MIAIVGDSFCSEYNRAEKMPYRDFQHYHNKESWVTDVVEYFDHKVDVHGYGGKSWWYSWSKFQECWHQQWHELSAVIFCHTEHNRINTCNPAFEFKRGGEFLVSQSTQKHAVDIFYKYLHDEQFQKFAQEQYAVMLKKKFSKIKTLHFFTALPLPEMISILPGTVFTTPLLHIVLSGIKGNKLEITRQINDQGKTRLVNHLTPANNTALAKIVIESLENYQPGVTQIDMSNFVILNNNYAQWPSGDWSSND